MIRLIIYLIISLGLIALLYTVSLNSKQVNKKIPTSSSVVELPLTDKSESNIKIQIDSLGNYLLNNEILTINELNDTLIVQTEKDAKLILEINVHPSCKSEHLLEIINLAQKMNFKIAIR